VGARPGAAATQIDCELFYWRDGNREVDFVARKGRTVTAIEVKTGSARDTLPGLSAFVAAFKPNRQLLVGGDGIAVEVFLRTPVARWLKA
jgi:hypothetical protein